MTIKLLDYAKKYHGFGNQKLDQQEIIQFKDYDEYVRYYGDRLIKNSHKAYIPDRAGLHKFLTHNQVNSYIRIEKKDNPLLQVAVHNYFNGLFRFKSYDEYVSHFAKRAKEDGDDLTNEYEALCFISFIFKYSSYVEIEEERPLSALGNELKGSIERAISRQSF